MALAGRRPTLVSASAGMGRDRTRTLSPTWITLRSCACGGFVLRSDGRGSHVAA